MNPHYCLLTACSLFIKCRYSFIFAAYKHVQDLAVYWPGLSFWAPAPEKDHKRPDPFLLKLRAAFLQLIQRTQQVAQIRHPKSVASRGWKEKALRERRTTQYKNVQDAEEIGSKPPGFLRRGRQEVGLWPGHGDA